MVDEPSDFVRDLDKLSVRLYCLCMLAEKSFDDRDVAWYDGEYTELTAAEAQALIAAHRCQEGAMPLIDEADVRGILAGLVAELGSYRAVGERLSLDHAYLYRVVHGTKHPGKKLLSALGLIYEAATYRQEDHP